MYIVRILFMVPIYALVSFASFLFWNHSTVLILVRDAYESTVLTAFFYLILMYVSHDPEEQKAVFLKVGLSREADREARKKGEKVKRWVFPLGPIKWKPQDGLYFLQLAKWGVLQYCVIRPTTTLAAVILDYKGLYCEDSWGLGWGHIYITIIVSISVTVAMYCLIQLYVPLSPNLAPHRPLLKLFAIKAVVFLTFWQATFLSVLSMFGVVKDTKYMTATDVNIGIGAVLETVEMTLFAFLHIRAFSYKPYQHFDSPNSMGSEPEKTPRLRSLGHAMDFRETFREIWIGWIYIWDKMRGKEPAYDVGARRTAHYEEAFGRPRTSAKNNNSGADEISRGKVATLPKVEIEVLEDVDVDIEGERQWLGLGDDYGYGLQYSRREKSDSLGTQIEKELEKRGLTTDISQQPNISPPPDVKRMKGGRQPSWWRRIYNRFSEYGSEDEHSQMLMARRSKRRSRRHSRGTRDDGGDYEPNNDDPTSIPVPHLPQRHHYHEWTSNHDILAPLPIFSDPAPSRQSIPAVLTNSGNNPTTPSSDVDSLLGRVFPRSAESQSSRPSDAASSLSSQGPIDERRRKELLGATHQMLNKYYEFGHGSPIPVGTRRKDRVAPGPSSVQIIIPKEVRSYHRRESALHSLNVAPTVDSLALPVQFPAQSSSGRARETLPATSIHPTSQSFPNHRQS
ncbi:hypothetical protein DXG01_010081 [Tephrocybe rancida]|nr:hypothetical protein DXG01_010081 [Tephrocybe rancida]